MKRNFYLYILALVLCVGLSSCNKEKEYTCRFKIQYDSRNTSDSSQNLALNNEEQEFKQACTDVFKADKDRYFTIIANDKASLTAQVNDLCNQIEAKFNGREFLSHYTLQVGTITKGNKDDSEICSREFGSALDLVGDYGCETWQLKDIYYTYYYNDIDNKITGLGISNDYDRSYTYYNGTFHWVLGLDLNKDAGWLTDDIYLYAASMEAQSTWNTKPVTHMIICWDEAKQLYSNSTVVYDGRTYQMASSINGASLDLNAGTKSGHKVLYLMYTKDYNGGYELRNIRGLCSGSEPNITQYDFDGAGNYNEVAPLVHYKNGQATKWENLGDCNKGLNADCLYLQGRYVKSN